MHDAAVESSWCVCVRKSGQASTREPADLLGDAFVDQALVNGKRVDSMCLILLAVLVRT